MATTNDITGDAIQTGVVTNSYRDNWEKIWGKKTPQEKDDAKAEDDEFERIKREFDEKVIMKPDFTE
jgi:FAD/FMN-containing dehydrogenase